MEPFNYRVDIDHLCLVDPSIITVWTGPFPVSDYFYYYHLFIEISVLKGERNLKRYCALK